MRKPWPTGGGGLSRQKQKPGSVCINFDVPQTHSPVRTAPKADTPKGTVCCHGSNYSQESKFCVCCSTETWQPTTLLDQFSMFIRSTDRHVGINFFSPHRCTNFTPKPAQLIESRFTSKRVHSASTCFNNLGSSVTDNRPIVLKRSVSSYTKYVVFTLQLKCNDTREGKWTENWRMEWVASTLHTTSEHGVSSITTTDVHTSAASSRLNWRSRRFKWTSPFRRKTKPGFCACAITFQLVSTA